MSDSSHVTLESLAVLVAEQAKQIAHLTDQVRHERNYAGSLASMLRGLHYRTLHVQNEDPRNDRTQETLRALADKPRM
jgi:uncharacterized coiled-coil protein SlyX